MRSHQKRFSSTLLMSSFLAGSILMLSGATGATGLLVPGASAASPPVMTLTGEKRNEGGVQVLPNGDILLVYLDRSGDHKTYYAQVSRDHGMTWSEPEAQFAEEEISHGMTLLLDNENVLHMLYLVLDGRGREIGVDRLLPVHHRTKTLPDGEWSEGKKVFDGYVGALLGGLETRDGRLMQAFSPWVGGATGQSLPHGPHYSTVILSDDRGETWYPSSARLVAPIREGYNGSNYGAIEPHVVEMQDGRIWMLIRTQNGVLYESFSHDGGYIWESARPSRFTTSNSPANFLRLEDGRLVILWNNCEMPLRHNGNGVYGGRDEIHAAISDDDGETWRGFRTFFRDPTRNDTPPRRGDRGTAYPDATQAADGSIVVLTGQAEQTSIIRFHPDWLLETTASEDFSSGLDNWSVFKHIGEAEGWWRDRVQGADLVAVDGGGQALRIARTEGEDPNGAAWNFPLGWKGELELEILLEEGSETLLTLADRFIDPTDARQVRSFGVYHQELSPTTLGVEAGTWQTLNIEWDLDAESAVLTIAGVEGSHSIPLGNATVNGISYLHLQTMSDEDGGPGLLLRRTHAESHDPIAPPVEARTLVEKTEEYLRQRLAFKAEAE